MPIFKFEKLGRRDRGLDVTVQGRPKSFRRGADSSKISFKSFPSRTTGPTWKPPSYYSVPESDEDDVIAAAMRGGINRATKTHINNVTKHGMDVSIHPSILRIQKAREEAKRVQEFIESHPEIEDDEDIRISPAAVDHDQDVGMMSLNRAPQAKAMGKGQDREMLAHTQDGFWEDLKNFREGTIPQSIAVALTVGVVCGIGAFLYYKVLFFLLEFIWHTVPRDFVADRWPEEIHCLWLPLVGLTMATLVGLSVKYVGEPGDLAYTIKCVHEKAYVSMNHVTPMVCASLFSILGGGSLGPEAPLVAICAALGGFVSRSIFKQRKRNVVRKHTLMGMAGALAAFFGSPLGGSLFALEVNSRFGVEYFEHLVEAIFCGEVTLVVFRTLSGLPIQSIYNLTEAPIPFAKPTDVILGAGIGLLGAGVASMFAALHYRVMGFFERRGLLDNERAVQRALLGSSVFLTIGLLVPHTMFWGEAEFESIARMDPSSTLEHVWPTSGLLGFEITGGWSLLIVGVCKIFAISFTVASGFRGGFIFPFFSAGAAFGRTLTFVFPNIPLPIAALCFAAGINVAITRTSLATSIILCYLTGEQQAMAGVLAASLTSLFATAYLPFIKTQTVRDDIRTEKHLDAVAEVGDVAKEGNDAAEADETTPLKSVLRDSSGGGDSPLTASFDTESAEEAV